MRLAVGRGTGAALYLLCRLVPSYWMRGVCAEALGGDKFVRDQLGEAYWVFELRSDKKISKQVTSFYCLSFSRTKELSSVSSRTQGAREQFMPE